jgi:pilus assembly protein CpaB
VIEVGAVRAKPANTAQDAQADPGQVVPVTFALSKKQELRVTYAQVFAQDVRLALLRPGDRPERTLDETIFRGTDPKPGDEGVTR